jgi:hypothetical protein
MGELTFCFLILKADCRYRKDRFFEKKGFQLSAFEFLLPTCQILKLFYFLLLAFKLFLLPLQSFWAEYTGAAQEIEQNLLKSEQKVRF